MKPKGKVKIRWSQDFVYALGLLVTDGCLLSDGRHLDFTSKDLEQINNFKKCLKLDSKIGQKKSSYTDKKYFRVQFGDVIFYNFLLSIGFTPVKTKTIGEVNIPKKYFFDFLRGHLDGDGYFYSYWDNRWKNSFMFYLGFLSASKDHINWIRSEISDTLKIKGHITHGKNSSIFQLKYAKKESLILLKKIYHSNNVVCLSRKRLKIKNALSVVNKIL